MLFLKRLALESNVKAQESKEKTLQAHHVNAVLRVSQSNGSMLGIFRKDKEFLNNSNHQPDRLPMVFFFLLKM